MTIDAAVARMRERLDDLPPSIAHRQVFLETYLRTTEAVGAAIGQGRFEDGPWVERWDVAFAELYLAAQYADLMRPGQVLLRLAVRGSASCCLRPNAVARCGLP